MLGLRRLTPVAHAAVIFLVAGLSPRLPPLIAQETKTGRAASRSVDYSRDILPVLSQRCFACHGPDETAREAGLRLDVREAAVDYAIAPGDPAESPVFQRISSEDADLRMPPPASKKPRLTPSEVALVKAWIEQGATYDGHWAYVGPERPELPGAADQSWIRTPVDRFIAAEHQSQGIEPAPEADRRILARRLSLDLIGLPPDPAVVDAFLADRAPDAYEQLVDELLASPHFGERMAVYWLDVVRYADTGGYHSDNHRDVWLYRDYVIDAFNANKPFDRFVVEQVAGDLLPDAGREQRIASGFNRLLQTTEEGGAQPKEYTAKYAADRVRNTAGAFLGATMGCAECHDHKYDPYTQRDFYRFAAFFADVSERAVGRQAQTPLPTADQKEEIDRLQGAVAAQRKMLNRQTPELDAAQAAWEKSVRERTVEWSTLLPVEVRSQGGASLTVLDDGTIQASGESPEKDTYSIAIESLPPGATALRLEVLPDNTLPAKGPGRAENGNFVLSEIALKQGGKALAWSATSATHEQKDYPVSAAADNQGRTGWAILPQTGKASAAVFEIDASSDKNTSGKLVCSLSFQYGSRHTLGRFGLAATTASRPVRAGKHGLPGEIEAALAVMPDKRSDQQRAALAAYHRSISPLLAPERAKLAELEKQLESARASVPTSLVSESLGSPRTVRVLPRGNWMDDSGDVVEPAIPEFFGRLAVGERRPTRLDLANWIVARDNPLAARVFVNRLWRLFFGEGLVRTVEDLGTQGTLPTHPKLLDWLAVELIESGWDVKHVVRLIVTSSTYRQASQADAAVLEKDPENRWLARQGRFRIEAELVRDTALAASGLLVPTIGGPSVKPYQPAGYWQHLNFPRRKWVAEEGEDQYRRGLYTYWQRTFLHPGLLAFDAPSREECTARRPRSSTPLQALVLLNDPTYVEAARVLAARMIRQGGSAAADRIALAYRRALAREPRPEEVELLTALLVRHRGEYTRDPSAANELLAVGDAPVPEGVDRVELAAWTSVARSILNLHETITRY